MFKLNSAKNKIFKIILSFVLVIATVLNSLLFFNEMGLLNLCLKQYEENAMGNESYIEEISESMTEVDLQSTTSNNYENSSNIYVEQPNDSDINYKDTWKLTSGNSSIVLATDEKKLYIKQFTTPSGISLQGDLSPFELPTSFSDSESYFDADWEFEKKDDFKGTENGVSVTGIVLSFLDSSKGLKCKVYALTRPSLAGPFEIYTEIISSGSKALNANPKDFFSFTTASGKTPTAWAFKKESGYAEGINFTNTSTYFEGTGIEKTVMDSNGGFSSWVSTNSHFNLSGYIPMIYMDYENYGFYVALKWSSGRVTGVVNDDNSATITVNMDDVSEDFGEFETKLPKNNALRLPSVFLGAYDGDVEIGSNSFKKWFFGCQSPKTIRENPNEPFTQMDMQFGVNVEGLGIQSIKWDYGWWSNHIYDKGSSWPKTLEGSWKLRSDNYINTLKGFGLSTLKEFGDFTDSKGLNWATYLLLHDSLDENLNVTTAGGEFNSITHPEWFTNRHIATKMGANADLGNKECVEYLKKALLNFFKGNNINTWRTDFEPISYTSDKENRHYANGTDVQYWNTVGFLEIVDYLYDNFDGFRYESCSAGGSMKDLITASRAVVINCDDSANYLSLRTTLYDSSYCIPPAQLQLPLNADMFCTDSSEYFWAVNSSNAPNFEKTMKDMGFRTMIMSAIHISSWSGPANSKFKFGLNEYCEKYFNMYNNKIKPLIRNGDLYHILPRPDGTNWDGMMYADADSQNKIKGVVFLFKPSAGVGATKNIKLRGLNPQKNYLLTFEDRKEQNTVLSGSVLMNNGISVRIDDIGSEIIWIEEA